jgi:predicted nucleic acid-binding protein
VRVVFDTNILVSALVFPGGRGEAALQRIIEEQDELVLSKPIVDELLGILARKFSRDAVTGDRALLALHNFRGVRLLSLRDYLDGRTE